MRRTWSDGKRLSKKEGGYDWMYHGAVAQAAIASAAEIPALCRVPAG
jgi:hypothetical protein